MKKIKYITLITGFLFLNILSAASIWVSDEIQAPLRDKPELNSKIIIMIPAGEKVKIIKTEKDYTQIKTKSGKKGWLSNYYILKKASIHSKYNPILKELVKIKKDNKALIQALELKKQTILKLEDANKGAAASQENLAVSETNIKKLQAKVISQDKEITALKETTEKANKKAINAQTKYINLVKVSENAVKIAEKNKALSEINVANEKEIQSLKNKNQNLTSQVGSKAYIIGGSFVFAGLLIGYILSIMMPARRKRHYL